MFLNISDIFVFINGCTFFWIQMQELLLVSILFDFIYLLSSYLFIVLLLLNVSFSVLRMTTNILYFKNLATLFTIQVSHMQHILMNITQN